jgi:hypothetical protein
LPSCLQWSPWQTFPIVLSTSAFGYHCCVILCLTSKIRVCCGHANPPSRVVPSHCEPCLNICILPHYFAPRLFNVLQARCLFGSLSARNFIPAESIIPTPCPQRSFSSVRSLSLEVQTPFASSFAFSNALLLPSRSFHLGRDPSSALVFEELFFYSKLELQSFLGQLVFLLASTSSKARCL